MKKTIILSLLLMLCLYFLATAQESQQPPIRLEVGSRVPESFWQTEHSVYANGVITKQTLAPHKGKLLMLDFWATWCGTCVGKFPITDSLKREFKSLEIVLINSNSKDNLEKVKEFYANNQNAKLHPLPTIVNDSSLKATFPHKYSPHYVFIDHRGMVIAYVSYHFMDRQIIANLVRQQRATLKTRP